MINLVLFSSLIVLSAVFNTALAQQQSHLLFNLNQLSGKTYCFDRDDSIGANDPRQLLRQSDRDSIRVALGTSGMAEAVTDKCDYRVKYSIAREQYQEIEMQPVGVGPGPFWGGYPYGTGRYPGWGPAGSVSWVPVIVTRQIYRLDLSLFNNRMSGMQVYKGTAYMVNNGQDIRMIIPNLANNIMQGFPMNNQLQ